MRTYKRKSIIQIDHFNYIEKLETAYILGFLWGDGYIWKSKKNNSCIISCENTIGDMNIIQKYFDKVGIWNKMNSEKKNSNKRFLKLYTADRGLYDFLFENGYATKIGNYDKILSKIPTNLQKYWWRGLVDADGCIYYNEKRTHDYYIDITSHFEQNWKSLENLCQQLKIGYLIKHITNKAGHKYSVFHISSMPNILGFGNFIYENFESDKIGLLRKYTKFLQIKDFSKKIKRTVLIQRDQKGKVILKNLIGQTFTNLKVIENGGKNPHNQQQWQCKCKCGNEVLVAGHSLKTGRTKSCGCYVNKKARQQASERMTSLNKARKQLEKV